MLFFQQGFDEFRIVLKLLNAKFLGIKCNSQNKNEQTIVEYMELNESKLLK